MKRRISQRRVNRLERGHIRDGDWRRLLGNAFGEGIVDHYMATILYENKARVKMEKVISCCDAGTNFRRRHNLGFASEEQWMEFALKRMEDGQVLERDPDGKPAWRKTALSMAGPDDGGFLA